MRYVVVALLFIMLAVTLVTYTPVDEEKMVVRPFSLLVAGIDGFPTLSLADFNKWFDDALTESPAVGVPVIGQILTFFVNLARCVAFIPVVAWNFINVVVWFVELTFVSV